MLAIKYSTWELIWWMADDTLKTTQDTIYGTMPGNTFLKDVPSLQKYRVGGDAVKDGPKNQHGLLLLEGGVNNLKLAMFDNQGDEMDSTTGSRYVEYQITKDSSGSWTAKKSDEFRDASLYSKIVSDVDLTGNNNENLLITYGAFQAKILEMTKQGKTLLFRLDLPFLSYRTEKMPLYYESGRKYPEDSNLKQPLVR